MPDDRPPWRCETCRWWEEIYPVYKGEMTVGGCGLTMAESSPDVHVVSDCPYPNSKAHAMWFFPDGDEFVRVMLETRADFGCNQWEERE